MLDHDPTSYATLIAPAFVDGVEGGLTRDDILDNVTLFWLTNTGVSTAKSYWEYLGYGSFANVRHVTVPVAVSVFPDELFQAPRSWTEKAYPNLIHFNEVDRGGHFAAWEQPELYASELRGVAIAALNDRVQGIGARRTPPSSLLDARRTSPTTRWHQVKQVVAPVVERAVGKQERDVGRERVDEFCVVAHQHDGTGPRRQRGADRGARWWVEVVGGLVEQQQVVTTGDELREGELRLLAARQSAGVLERNVARQAERTEYAAPFGLGRERAVAQMIDYLRACDDSFVFLCVVADRDAGTEHHIAGVVRLEPGENAQERRLAGAVEAEHEHALAPPRANASSDQIVRPPNAFVRPSICRTSRPLCGGGENR